MVACPLCQMNLDLRQGQINAANETTHSLPVPYFTQLMSYAFGLDDKAMSFDKLAVPIQGIFTTMESRKAAAEANAAAKAKPEKAATEAGGAA